MMPAPAWQPSHVLTWTPRSGVVRSWIVRVIATTIGGRHGHVAQTIDEHNRGVRPAWTHVEGEQAWTWRGRGGYQGEDGVAQLERVTPLGEAHAQSR